MTTTGQAMSSGPWQATVTAQLSRGNGIDTVEEIEYTANGEFTRQIRVVNGPSPLNIVVLNTAQCQQLLAELQGELTNPPAGTNVVGLRVFADLLEDSLATEPSPSHLFDNAKFGTVTHDETRGVLFGHVGLGLDVVGTVRDMAGNLTLESHVVPRGHGPYRPLSPADRESLVAALDKANGLDPLWKQIAADAK
jgi:hypothetical protein